MKYCLNTTSTHPLANTYNQHLQSLTKIFQSEGYRGVNLFLHEKAINLDQVEKEKSCKEKRSPNATMDFSIGLSKDDKNKKMLLVELKLNIKNPGNISKSELDNKMKNSVMLLSQDIPILQEKIILFQLALVQQARRIVARLYNNNPNLNIEIQSAEDFKGKYF